jgi:hypothetical protein
VLATSLLVAFCVMMRLAATSNAAERYSSVTALADDLRRYLRHEPISVGPETAAYGAQIVRRNPLPWSWP